MTAEGIDWLSPDELLDGLPSRRASLLLFAIESRTAQLVASDQRDAALFVPPAIAEEREREFLQALAAGRELPLEPKIQDIERFAAHWRSLVPEDAGVRAAVAHMLARSTPSHSETLPVSKRPWAWPMLPCSRLISAITSTPWMPSTRPRSLWANGCAGAGPVWPAGWRRCRPSGWLSS